ncbi:hypothetical protein SAMN06297387_10730 [Streptomyces zhaozhouensis]|uniref:Uncharacterized protein n=1 Tax=Streptomyces zhaozhouensis TaxID=1300267 RepID=A0A286DVH0_9ACTN|nr:hypothetical protein [Streptomyces zhaozhouensis]SOD62657.1 hypothetical protein SAMN06297387_10730 [Streptomyces zhaozhouensis]
MTENRVEVCLAPDEDSGGEPTAVEDELRSLVRWLRTDESLAHGLVSRLEARRPAGGDEMGAALDVVALVLGSGLSAGALAVSVLQWRDARRSSRPLVVRRGAWEVRIPPGRPADEETLARLVALLEAADAVDGNRAGDGGEPDGSGEGR